MTEDEYVFITDLTRIIAAKNLLSECLDEDILPLVTILERKAIQMYRLMDGEKTLETLDKILKEEQEFGSDE